jgi:hypothetical protein
VKRPEVGPIYGVVLIDKLSIGINGGMMQQMPSRDDLQSVRQVSERTVAGFEVLTSHYNAKVYSESQLLERVAELTALVAKLESKLEDLRLSLKS